MRYLLCEDSTGGFTFWENVNKLLLAAILMSLTILPVVAD